SRSEPVSPTSGATWLVADSPALLATAATAAAAFGPTAVIVRFELLAVPNGPPFLGHWNVNGGVPPAVTEKLALPPALTTWLNGSAVIVAGNTTGAPLAVVRSWPCWP